MSAQAPQESGLIAYFPMDGTANDESAYANHGVIHGGVFPDKDMNGFTCGALNFNGTDGYISVPNTAVLSEPTKKLSVVLWVRVDERCNDQDRDWFTIICKSDQAATSAASPQYRFQASTMTVSINTEFSEFSEKEFEFEFGTWFQLAMIYDGREVRLYKDARLVSNYPYTGRFQANNMDLEIGRDMPGRPEYFCGAMDELRIYNRNLSISELETLMRVKRSDEGPRSASLKCP
ncbi:MAG: LamG-like jellyroll fold domain-containing protein, partial [Bacteroidota bacterium]